VLEGKGWVVGVCQEMLGAAFLKVPRNKRSPIKAVPRRLPAGQRIRLNCFHAPVCFPWVSFSEARLPTQFLVDNQVLRKISSVGYPLQRKAATGSRDWICHVDATPGRRNIN